MDRPLTLAYVTCYLDTSGVSKLNWDILKRLKEQGVQIHVITTEGASTGGSLWETLFDIYVDRPFKLCDVEKSKRLQDFANYVRDWNISLIFATHSLWLYENIAKIKEMLPHIKIVDSLHVLEPYKIRGGFPDISASQYVHPFIDRSILISEDLRAYLRRFYAVNESKLDVIRNGIDIEHFATGRSSDGGFRCELGLKKEDKLIGFIGRFVEQKRPLLFLEIARQTALRYGSFFFYMIGGGKMRSRMEAFIEKHHLSQRITVFGERTDIDHVLASTDLLLMPSLYEGAPLTILEALAAGVRVIASDVGAIREYVGNSCSLVARDREETEIATFLDEITTYLKKPADPTSAVCFVREHYDINKTALQYKNVFLSAVGMELSDDSGHLLDSEQGKT